MERDTTDRIASPVAGEECHQDEERRPSGLFRREHAGCATCTGLRAVDRVEDFFDATDLDVRAAKLAALTLANCAKS